MPRSTAEPFMRIVGEMLELEDAAAGDDIIDAAAADVSAATTSTSDVSRHRPADIALEGATPTEEATKPEVAEELVPPRPSHDQARRPTTGQRGYFPFAAGIVRRRTRRARVLFRAQFFRRRLT